MTFRPTEYIALKRLMYFRKDHDPNLNGTEANTIIYDSVTDAYDKLDYDDMVQVGRQRDKLTKHVKELGDNGALELIAAVGDALNNGRRK